MVISWRTFGTQRPGAGASPGFVSHNQFLTKRHPRIKPSTRLLFRSTKMNSVVNSRPINVLEKSADPTAFDSKGVDSGTTSDSKVVGKESSYWNNFYAGKFDIAVPSQFCVLVATEGDKTKPVVEFGCGNGRDSIYLARHGFKVFAGDLSKEAIQKNREKEEPHKENPATFNVCDVAKAKDVQALLREARDASEGGNVTVYNRFFLHSLDDEQERLFLTAVAEASQAGDHLYMEFRCSLDANVEKLYKDHYRRFVDTSKLVVFLKELGYEIEYEITGQGMAKYKTEDPFVSRIVAIRQ